MLGNERFGVRASALKHRQGRLIADVAERDTDVSEQAASLRAKNRRVRETALESNIIKREEFNEIRLCQILSSVSLHDLTLSGETVPWANRKAIIAAVNPIANGATKLDRNRSFQFDGQIRNATTRIELEWRCDRGCWTSLQAARARSAAIPFGRIRLQFERRDDLSQKNPVAQL